MSITQYQLGRKFSLLVIPLLLLSSPLRSQPDVIVDQILKAPIEVLSINDLDFINSTTPKWLFTIVLRTTDGNTIDSVIMDGSLAIRLSNSEFFPEALTFTTAPFPVGGSRTITNLDFRSSISVPGGVNFDNNAKRRLEELALPSGHLPAGTYDFRITARSVNGGTGSSAGFQLVITNPSAITLISPLDGDIIPNPFPLFEWHFDGSRSEISVFEKLPGQTSYEEAATGIPQLQRVVSTTSFQYPTSGVRPLLPGKTYVWFVRGLASTTGGSAQADQSPLRSLTVASGGASTYSALLAEIERSVPPKYLPLIEQIKAQGLSPTGVIRLNGSTITVSELLDIFQTWRNNPESVSDVGLE